MWRGVLAVALALTLPATAAHATWSIVAVDPATGEVGSAGASCTPFVVGIARLAPGHGAIVAQAASNMHAKARGAEMIADGVSAHDVVAAISSIEFDENASMQQYGVATLRRRGGASAAAYTGADTPEAHGQRVGREYAVQGNTLTGTDVLDATAAAFERARARGTRLDAALMAALEAGARAGGDNRCGAKTAQSAYLGVAQRDDAPGRPSLRLVVTTEEDDARNPVAELRRAFDAR